MNHLNQIIIEGNVVKEPEKKVTLTGNSACTVTIACEKAYRKQNGEIEKVLSYFDIDAWGSLADACEKNCTKDKEIRAVGCLRQNRWRDSDGKMNSKIVIVAEHIEFLKEMKKEEEKKPAKKRDNSVGMEM